MKRRKKLSHPNGKSKLTIALETGKVIKGMKGFVNVNTNNSEPLFVPVKIEGLKTSQEEDDDCACGDLMIRGTIQGTKSPIAFKVKQWADDLKTVESNTAARLAVTKAETELDEIMNHHYLSRKRLALQTYVADHLTKEQEKEYHDNILEVKKDQRPMSESEVKDFAQIAVCVANNVTPDMKTYKLGH